MQDPYAGFDDSDTDRTDELPVLSEAAVWAVGGQLPDFDDEDTGEHPVLFAPRAHGIDRELSHDAAAIATLEEALKDARRDLDETRAAHAEQSESLAQHERELAEVKNEFHRQRQQIGELRIALKQLQQRHTSLLEHVGAAKEELAKQTRLAAEGAGATEKVRRYRDEIQTLTAYIAGSSERWKAMEASASSQNERITDLQRELEQRIERQQSAEHQSHSAAKRLHDLKAKLADALTALRARERDLAVLKRSKAADRTRNAQADLAAKLAQQQALLDERETQLQAANEERATLERRLAETQASLERLQAVGRQDERIAALQQDLSERISALRNVRVSAKAASDVTSAQAKKSPPPTPPGESRQVPMLVCLTSDALEKHVIGAPEMTIGRGSECEIRIFTHFVSRQHARLKRAEGKVTIEDCGSTNGVFVNSVRVEQQELEHGDWVTIGETQFRFLHESASPG
jgi:hypothetical protein